MYRYIMYLSEFNHRENCFGHAFYLEQHLTQKSWLEKKLKLVFD